VGVGVLAGFFLLFDGDDGWMDGGRPRRFGGFAFGDGVPWGWVVCLWYFTLVALQLLMMHF
jgi:hypothetical protein